MAKAKQERLPGTEDPAIQELHDAAMSYAEVRDERMALTPKESDAKATVLQLMKKHKKRHYKHNGIEISVVTEEETVKVKVAKKKEEDEEAA